MSKFKQIMVHLNPRTIIEKTQIPHDNARASVTLQSSIVGSYREFENIIVAYVSQHSQMVLGMSYPPDLCLDKARGFLDSSLGFDNAVYIAMSGDQGGVPNVLNEINEGFKKEARQAYFTYFLDQYIDPLNFEEIVELMRELKQRIGTYSPESFNYVSPEQMTANYRDVLYKYIDSVSRYRNLWTY